MTPLRHYWDTPICTSLDVTISAFSISRQKVTMASLERSSDRIPSNLIVLLFSFVTLLRVLIGFQPHSGEKNHHGSTEAYGGDFEAQRHWMELTVHLPIGDWYWYDLEYWGLDYPPLTAYISWICGVGSHLLVGPESVAFEASRGIEDPLHKAYMRATVLVLDLLIYGSAIWFTTANRRDLNRSLWAMLLALAQPAIILIDHGHFQVEWHFRTTLSSRISNFSNLTYSSLSLISQYNTVALGFSIWSFHFMAQPDFFQCIYGAVIFCLALNFKQMTLYYAPAVFMYLLGRCCAEPKQFVKRFASLGITVILTFGILWAPFLYYGPSHKETTVLERALHVLHRIFPFQRGLFEGKVSNLWCALSTKPVSIRERVPAEWLPILALGTTLMLIVPACYRVFRVGLDQRARIENRDWTQLLWASTSTALAFFLASFQVHEKSILLALSPASLLLWQDPIFFEWFSLACTWTLWPLLQVDRLEVTYFCSMIIFGCLLWLRRQSETSSDTVFLSYLGWLPTLCYFGMAGLHLAQAVVNVPEQLPDLFAVLWSIAGCGMFCLAWLVTCWKLHTNETCYKVKAKAD